VIAGRIPAITQIGAGMANIALSDSRSPRTASTAWDRLKANRNWLGFWFMLPAMAFLILFLAYPLGLGVWLSFTDAKIGRSGIFIGLENYEWLWDDSVFWLSVFNTLLYTIVASLVKFAIGLYLALLLNENLPFKAMLRAIVLIPFIVPTVLSAIAFWWIYDSQFSIISWSLRHLGLISGNIDFLGDPWHARWSVIFANIWRGVPFVAITLLAGLQTVSPSLYEAATIDGATRWQIFRHVTYPLLTPIIAVVMTFSVLFTFTDFQLIWVLTRGGPVNATQLMATLSYQRAILSGQLGEGAAISTAMIPFLLAAILMSWFGLQRRKWQQGESND
jgi:multiple sugar transport system permease protein